MKPSLRTLFKTGAFPYATHLLGEAVAVARSPAQLALADLALQSFSVSLGLLLY